MFIENVLSYLLTTRGFRPFWTLIRLFHRAFHVAVNAECEDMYQKYGHFCPNFVDEIDESFLRFFSLT